MKPHYFLTLFIAVAGLLSPSSHAQQNPKQNAKALVSVRVGVKDEPTTSTWFFRMWQDGQTPDVIPTASAAGAGAGNVAQMPAFYALLTPNKEYRAAIDSASYSYGEVKFSAPAGYTIWINDKPASTIRGSGNPFVVSKIELRSDTDSDYLPAGFAAAPKVSDVIWGVSAGRYSNGLSAGVVGWRQSSLTSDLLSPTSLSYLEPDSAEIAVTHHTDGALLEVKNFQMLLYVRRNSTAGTGYDIEIYDPFVVRTGSGNGPYTYDRSPYRVYRVSNPDGGTWANRVKIEKIEDSLTESWTLKYELPSGNPKWTITESGTLREVTRTSTGTAPRIETIEVKDGSGTLATKLTRKYQSFAWGQEELVEETANPDAVDGPTLTTSYDYHTTLGNGGYGRLKSVTRADGSWVVYSYDSTFAGFGNLTEVYQPWQDSTGVTAATATASNCLSTTLSYVGERDMFLDLPSGFETKIMGYTSSKKTISYNFAGAAPNGQPHRVETHTDYASATSTLVSTRRVYNPTAASTDFLGRVISQSGPDGTKVSLLRYQAYWWNSNDDNATNFHRSTTNPSANVTWGEYRFNGFRTAVSGSVAVNNWDGQTIDQVYMVPNQSTVSLDVYNSEGRLGWSVQYVFTGASSGTPAFEFLSMDTTAYDNGLPESVTGTNGSFQKIGYLGGRRVSTQSNDGGIVNYVPDALGRPTTIVNTGVGAYNSNEYKAQSAIYSHLSYDAVGNVLTRKLSSSDAAAANPADAVTTKTRYNKAGQPFEITEEDGGGNITTNITYLSGGRTVKAQLPAINGTRPERIATTWVDGSLKSLSGSGVVNQYREVTVNSNGTLTTAIYVPATALEIATPATSARYSKVTTDWLGRAVTEVRPAPLGASPSLFTKSYTYDGTSGKLTKTSETGIADTLIKYNALQQPYRVGQDLSTGSSDFTPNDELDASSSDRFTETTTVFEKDANGAWWTVVSKKSYQTEGSGTATDVGTVKTRWNKYGSGPVQSETVSFDIFGNKTTKKVSVQRGTSATDTSVRLVTETIDHSDSTVDEITVVRNGLLQKKQTPQNLIYRYYYDARGRLLKQTDPRTDSSETARVGYVSNSDRIAWRDDSAGNRTDYGYYSGSGLIKSETMPAATTGGTRPVSYVEYTLRGEARRRWGNGTYPVEYEFNGYGETFKMRTFRATAAIDYTTASWPHGGYPSPDYSTATPTGGDPTIWSYDEASGTLKSKTVSATATDTARTTSYTYNSRGQLKSRMWARGVGTDYYYFGEQSGEPRTGELRKVDYGDGGVTTDLVYKYNRMGLSKEIDDATGRRSFEYCDCGKTLYELFDSTYFGSRKLTYKIDSTTTGAKGRTYGYTLAVNTGGGAIDQDVAYAYDPATARLTGITSDVTYAYSYTPNSNLISAIIDTSSSLGWMQTRTYLANRNLIDVIETKFGVSSKAAFDYAYDDLGRRTNVVNSGEMFARYAGAGLFTNYGYNERSELTSGATYAGRDTGNTASPIPARSFGYDFDNIGNRKSASVDGVSSSYESDSRNQYKERAVSGRVAVTGFSAASATVNITVDSTATSANRFTVGGVANDFYFNIYNFSGSNGSSALWKSFSFSGSAEVRTSFVAKTPEAFVYDADGNMTSDGRWSYAYDAENRLIAMETLADIRGTLGTSSRKLQFAYDYQGRRIRKAVYNYSGTAYPSTPSLETKFIYEGWNMIAEYNSGTLQATYLWGMDLSGGMQGAGGVGGLLHVKRVVGGIYQPSYDGNGNVMALTAQTGGSIAASYEYSPFGEILRSEGTQADNNPWRYSSKYTDAETSLIYYGYRYYDPHLGRFICRDPKEELGGLNLYAFVANGAINRIDYLGLDEVLKLDKFVITGTDWSIWGGGNGTSYGNGPGGTTSFGGDPSISNNGTGGDQNVEVSNPNDTLELDKFVVNAPKPPKVDLDLPLPPIVLPPLPPLDVGEGFVDIISVTNTPERWSDEKCKGLAGQIDFTREGLQRRLSSVTGSRVPASNPAADYSSGTRDLLDNFQTGQELMEDLNDLAGLRFDGPFTSNAGNFLTAAGGAMAIGNIGAGIRNSDLSLLDRGITDLGQISANLAGSQIFSHVANPRQVWVNFTGFNSRVTSSARFLASRGNAAVVVGGVIIKLTELNISLRQEAGMNQDAINDIYAWGAQTKEWKNQLSSLQADYDKHCK